MSPARSARHSSSRLFLATVLATTGLRSATAYADELRAEDPDQHFRMGVTAFRRGDSEAAIHEFELAYRLSPHYSVLYNLGLAYAANGRIAQAANSLTRYLDEGGAEIRTERRQQVLDAIHGYDKQVGKIVFVLTPPDAEVSVDGAQCAAVATAEPVRMAVGVHQLVVRAPGRVPEERTVTVLAGKHQELRIELSPAPTQIELRDLAAPSSTGVASDAASASGAVRPQTLPDVSLTLAPRRTRTMSVDLALPPEAERQRDEQLRTRRTYAWITGGTGLAFGIAASVLYGVYVNQKRDWERQREEYSRLLSDGSVLDPVYMNAALRHEHAAMGVRRTVDAAIGAAAVGAALMTVGIVLYFVDGGSSPKRSAIPGRQAASTWPSTHVTW